MQLSYNRKKYTCQPDETVLEALLRQNVTIPHSCSQQICLSCLMCSLDGSPPAASQVGLNETLKLQNYFLACGCIPEQDMEISLPQESFAMEVPATILSVHTLNAGVLGIRLQCEDVILDYKSGQSVILLNKDNIGTQCPIVSPSDNRLTGQLEIHLDLRRDACFSTWAIEKLRTGTRVRLYGSIGRMIYRATTASQTILLAAKNAGLSTLLGIMQDIFSSEHTGNIYLFHEVDTLADLYLTDELSEIGDYYPNFHYIPCVLQSPQNNTVMTSANQRIRHTVTDLIGGQAFICGSKHFVLSIQKQSYLAGCNTNDIFVDITT